MPVAYPATVRPPLRASRTRAQAASFAVSSPAQGFGHVQRTGLDQPVEWDLTWRLTTSEAQALMQWFVHETLRGALPFTIELRTEFGLTEYHCRFLPDGLLNAREDGETWVYTASVTARGLKIVRAPYVSTALLARRDPGGLSYGEVSNGGRTYTFANNSSSWGNAWVRRGVSGTGKRYVEVVNVGPQVTNFYAGFMAHSQWTASGGGYYVANPLGKPSYLAHYGTLGGGATGRIDNGSFASNGAYIWLAGEVCQIAVDFDAGRVWYGRNGSWLSGDPAAGIGQAQTLPNAEFDLYVGFYTLGTGTRVLTCNFNEVDWAHPAPAGFQALP